MHPSHFVIIFAYLILFLEIFYDKVKNEHYTCNRMLEHESIKYSK